MLSVTGVYENGKISLSEHIFRKGRYDIIITFPEDRQEIVKKDLLQGLLSDLDENDFNDILECYHNREHDWFYGRKYQI